MTAPTVNRLKHENIPCETIIKATKIRVLEIKGYYILVFISASKLIETWVKNVNKVSPSTRTRGLICQI